MLRCSQFWFRWAEAEGLTWRFCSLTHGLGLGDSLAYEYFSIASRRVLCFLLRLLSLPVYAVFLA